MVLRLREKREHCYVEIKGIFFVHFKNNRHKQGKMVVWPNGGTFDSYQMDSFLFVKPSICSLRPSGTSRFN